MGLVAITRDNLADCRTFAVQQYSNPQDSPQFFAAEVAHSAGALALFTGAQGKLVGLDQCNVRLPNSLAGRGEISIALTVDGRTSNTVTARIK